MNKELSEQKCKHEIDFNYPEIVKSLESDIKRYLRNDLGFYYRPDWKPSLYQVRRIVWYYDSHKYTNMVDLVSVLLNPPPRTDRRFHRILWPAFEYGLWKYHFSDELPLGTLLDADDEIVPYLFGCPKMRYLIEKYKHIPLIARLEPVFITLAESVFSNETLIFSWLVRSIEYKHAHQILQSDEDLN